MSVVVDDFDIMGSIVHPEETYPPLIIDTNRPLARSIALQLLEPVTGRLCQIAHRYRCIDRTQLASGDPNEIRWKALWTPSIKKNRTASILEASDRHRLRPQVSWHDTSGTCRLSPWRSSARHDAIRLRPAEAVLGARARAIFAADPTRIAGPIDRFEHGGIVDFALVGFAARRHRRDLDVADHGQMLFEAPDEIAADNLHVIEIELD